MNRKIELDIIKAVAIIAVVLYHLGIVKYGYLGVDMFFVVGGYLFCKSLIKEEKFLFLSFIIKRIKRLLPLVISVCSLSMLIGYFVMLPDDYENLGEAVVASTFFCENILEAITTKNYWNIENTYKPLMHLWYISVFFQLYFVVALLYLFCTKKDDVTRYFKNTLLFISIVSFVLNLMPFSAAAKFYFFPFRIFEFTLGGLIYFYSFNKKLSNIKSCLILSIMLIAICIFLQNDIICKELRLYFIVLSTSLLIASVNKNLHNNNFKDFIIIKILINIGSMSYSIYIWHQFLIAFILYSVVPRFDSLSYGLYFLLLSIISIISFNVFEKKESSYYISHSYSFLYSLAVISLANFVSGMYFYFNAGYTTDIPELDVYKYSIHRGMHAEYVDGPYKWTNSFNDSNKKNILVIGNSFGRDFANILNESSFSNKIEIYYYPNNKVSEGNSPFISQLSSKADYVFCSLGPSIQDLNPILSNIIPKDKLYVIGNKKFGYSNGIIYSKRFKEDYLDSVAEIDYKLLQHNTLMKNKYGSNFIDMFEIVLKGENVVRVFTDDGKFISQDTSHLTKAGAKYYSKMIKLEKYIKLK